LFLGRPTLGRHLERISGDFPDSMSARAIRSRYAGTSARTSTIANSYFGDLRLDTGMRIEAGRGFLRGNFISIISGKIFARRKRLTKASRIERTDPKRFLVPRGCCSLLAPRDCISDISVFLALDSSVPTIAAAIDGSSAHKAIRLVMQPFVEHPITLRATYPPSTRERYIRSSPRRNYPRVAVPSRAEKFLRL